MKYAAATWFSLLLLGGCASAVPIEIREPLAYSPSVTTVRDDLKSYLGKHVRWGGTIVSIENRPNDTWIEVIAKELGSDGRPRDSDVSLGRFVVRVEGFLDPAIYKAERKITAYGVVEAQITRRIGEYPYPLPLVKAERFYLWPEYRSYRYRHGYPYWYYPYWYYPYYPHYFPLRPYQFRPRPFC